MNPLRKRENCGAISSNTLRLPRPTAVGNSLHRRPMIEGFLQGFSYFGEIVRRFGGWGLHKRRIRSAWRVGRLLDPAGNRSCQILLANRLTSLF